MNSLRQRLRQLCIEKIDESISSLQQTIGEAQTAQEDDTKSSAGDKFETTREMMTQEIEKGNTLLAKLYDEKNRLQAIPSNEDYSSVQHGSVVVTNHEKFYVGVSVGSIILEGEKYQTVSASSPIGQLMLNKKEGDSFQLHEKEYVIERIY